MRVRRTRLDPWPFPWTQAFPRANWRQQFRTGPSHPHVRIGLGWSKITARSIACSRAAATVSAVIRIRRKAAAEASPVQPVEHRKVHLRSRSRDDEPTPAAFHGVELEPGVNRQSSVQQWPACSRFGVWDCRSFQSLGSDIRRSSYERLVESGSCSIHGFRRIRRVQTR